jgi:hypothetical protein
MIKAYDRQCTIEGTGKRGCLVSYLTGKKGYDQVPFSAISWASPDWDERDGALHPRLTKQSKAK